MRLRMRWQGSLMWHVTPVNSAFTTTLVHTEYNQPKAVANLTASFFLTSFNLLLILSIERSGIRAFVLTKLFIRNTTFYRIGRLCYRTLNTRKFYYFNILFVSAFPNQFQHSPGVLRTRASQRRLHRVRCSSFPIWLDFCKKNIPFENDYFGYRPLNQLRASFVSILPSRCFAAFHLSCLHVVG